MDIMNMMHICLGAIDLNLSVVEFGTLLGIVKPE